MRRFYFLLTAISAVLLVSCNHMKNKRLWDEIKEEKMEKKMQILDVETPEKVGDLFHALDASEYISINSVDDIPEIDDEQGFRITKDGTFYDLPVNFVIEIFHHDDRGMVIGNLYINLIKDPSVPEDEFKAKVEDVARRAFEFYGYDMSICCEVAAYTALHYGPDGIRFELHW